MNKLLKISALCLAFVACKKSSTNNTNNNPTLNASCAGVMGAVLYSQDLDLVSNGSYASEAYTAFSTQSTSLPVRGVPTVDVGSVTIQGNVLDKFNLPTGPVYSLDFLAAATTEKIQVDIQGGNGYPTISYETPNTIPTYTLTVDKSTLYANQDITLDFSDVQHADSVEIFLAGYPTFKVAASIGTYTFTAAELSSALSANSNAYFTTRAFSRSSQTFGNKELCFYLVAERRVDFYYQP